MKHNLKIALRTYNDLPFTKDLQSTEPMDLQVVLETACLNADPREFSTGDQKMHVFNLLTKVHGADPHVELTAEDVTLLKKLVGQQMSVAAVGAIYKALENPVS